MTDITKKIDPFSFRHVELSSPAARSGDVIVGTPFGEIARAIYIGVGGAITVKKIDGTTQSYVGLLGGVWYPIVCTEVTSATASNMVWWA